MKGGKLGRIHIGEDNNGSGPAWEGKVWAWAWIIEWKEAHFAGIVSTWGKQSIRDSLVSLPLWEGLLCLWISVLHSFHCLITHEREREKKREMLFMLSARSYNFLRLDLLSEYFVWGVLCDVALFFSTSSNIKIR